MALALLAGSLSSGDLVGPRGAPLVEEGPLPLGAEGPPSAAEAWRLEEEARLLALRREAREAQRRWLAEVNRMRDRAAARLRANGFDVDPRGLSLRALHALERRLEEGTAIARLGVQVDWQRHSLPELQRLRRRLERATPTGPRDADDVLYPGSVLATVSAGIPSDPDDVLPLWTIELGTATGDGASDDGDGPAPPQLGL